VSCERTASSALTVAHALPPCIRSIAERSSVIASAGISSQWSTAAAIRSVMATSSASGASTMMAATRASTSRRRPCWAVSDLLTHDDGTRRSRRVANTTSHCHLLVANPSRCQDGVAYAWVIPAWALCQACNTSADSRPRSLTR
jgi:hypothetical protein